MRAGTPSQGLEGSWSPVWIADPTSDSALDSSSESAGPPSQADLLEIDPEIYEEMNPTPSARYESLYLMDHLIAEETDDAADSGNLGSDWLLRATQASAPGARSASTPFESQTVIDLQASALDEGEIVRPAWRGRAPRQGR